MSELFDDISRIVGSQIPRRQAMSLILKGLAGAALVTLWPERFVTGQTSPKCTTSLTILCSGTGGDHFNCLTPMDCRDKTVNTKCSVGTCIQVPNCSDSRGVCCECKCPNQICNGECCLPPKPFCEGICVECRNGSDQDCPGNLLCRNNKCCPNDGTCTGNACCAPGLQCVGGICCIPSTRAPQQCCAASLVCGSTTCCDDPEKCCIEDICVANPSPKQPCPRPQGLVFGKPRSIIST